MSEKSVPEKAMPYGPKRGHAAGSSPDSKVPKGEGKGMEGVVDVEGANSIVPFNVRLELMNSEARMEASMRVMMQDVLAEAMRGMCHEISALKKEVAEAKKEAMDAGAKAEKAAASTSAAHEALRAIQSDVAKLKTAVPTSAAQAMPRQYSEAGVAKDEVREERARRTVVVGGFGLDVVQEEVKEAVKHATTGAMLVEEVFCYGRRSNIGFARFETELAKHEFLTNLRSLEKPHWKGRPMWIRGDRSADDRARGGKVGAMKKILIEIGKLPADSIEVDYKRGLVWIRQGDTGNDVVRVAEWTVADAKMRLIPGSLLAAGVTEVSAVEAAISNGHI